MPRHPLHLFLTVVVLVTCRPALGQTGACCLANDVCLDTTALECIQFGGDYQGNGTDCTPNPCAPEGACCRTDGTCVQLTQGACAQIGGNYLGNGTSCVSCPDPTGACCFTNGSCSILEADQCAAAGGAYEGDDTTCGAGTCPGPSGACCLPNGVCSILEGANCAAGGGVYYGDDSSCEGVTCTGACCLDDFPCLDGVSEVGCTILGGDFRGIGSSCFSSCAAACCLLDGSCLEITESMCDSLEGVHRAGMSCNDAECLAWFGVCTDGEGDCFVANGTVGCDDADCCEMVCAIDPFCCSTAWDTLCAQEAQNLCSPSCPCDSDGNGVIDAVDLLALLAGWGTAGGDCTGDGLTDVADLLALLAAWGECE